MWSIFTDQKTVEALPEQVIAGHEAVGELINDAGIIKPFAPLSQVLPVGGSVDHEYFAAAVKST